MIIGISGTIGSGKDTLASLIIKHAHSKYNDIPNRFVNESQLVKSKSFANKLKVMGAFLTGTEQSLWFTQEGKNIVLPAWGMTIGEFQQKLGTEAIRDGLHINAWVLALMADYDKIYNWIITDVRFPNEAEAVKERGGIVIRINGDPAGVRARSSRNLNHPSEIALDNYEKFDYIYTNDKSLADLEDFAKDIASKYL